jgi:hypothetical protein
MPTLLSFGKQQRPKSWHCHTSATATEPAWYVVGESALTIFYFFCVLNGIATSVPLPDDFNFVANTQARTAITESLTKAASDALGVHRARLSELMDEESAQVLGSMQTVCGWLPECLQVCPWGRSRADRVRCFFFPPTKDIDDITKNIIPCSIPVLHQHLYDLDLKFKQKTEASSEFLGTDEMRKRRPTVSIFLSLFLINTVVYFPSELVSFHGELASALHRRLLQAWDEAKAAVEKVSATR